MNEITIPYHFFIPALISLISILLIFIFRKKCFKNDKRKWLWINLIIFLLIYLYIVSSACYSDIYYQWDLNKYDLNNDGLFDSSERTKEQKLAMFKLTNDVGRNFSFITGFIFSGIIAFAIFIAGFIFNRVKQSK